MSDLDDLLGPEGRPEAPIIPSRKPPKDVLTRGELVRAEKLLMEVARRKSEALEIFEPLPAQDSFFRCRSKERIFLGANRAGKTLCGAVDFARMVCGKDPYNKIPKTNTRSFIVGKSWTHLGKVIARKLFRPGAFKMIKDPETGLWRSFRPLSPWDQAHKDQRRDAPPLIPPRMIKTLSWENKKEFQIKDAVLTNGSEFTFLTCDSDKPQGWDADLAWFDEEIHGDGWYIETQMRLIDRNGIFMWSATPQSGTIELYNLFERAEREEHDDKPSISMFKMTLHDNPHLDAEGKSAVLKSIENEADYEVRVLGEFARHGIRIYPEFRPRDLHKSPVDFIPVDWTRYVAIDPGVQVCAALFAACPPKSTPGLPDGCVIVYDELYIKRCDATIFAREMAKKCRGISIYEMTMDYRQGRYTQASGKTYAQHYSEALEIAGISCEKTGSGFVASSDDIEAGIESVRKFLKIDSYGQPRIFFVTENVPSLIKEMGRYSYIKRPSGEITDKPEPRVYHACDSLRYLCMREPSYRKPKPSAKSHKGTALAILDRKKEKAKMKRLMEKGSGVSLGSNS